MENYDLIELPRNYGNLEEISDLCDAISMVEWEGRKSCFYKAMNGRVPKHQIRKDTAARFEMVKLIDQMAEKAGRWDAIIKLMPELEDKLNE